jgi:uncharacterized membrane protein
MDTFVVSFVVLHFSGAAGSIAHAAKVSSGIAGVEIITKILLYYFHERAWGRIAFGKKPRPPTLEESAAENVP